MAHNLFGEKFFSLRRPAWHGLGKVLDQELTATAAFDLIGAYDIRFEDLTAGKLPTGHKAVIRSATPEDPQERVLSVVPNDYEIVTPRQVVEDWDKIVKHPVETIGALGKGETLFLTTRLPSYEVVGDEVENYMILTDPMTGNDAIWLYISGVRVVCQNTVIASKAAATEQHRILHNSQARNNLRLWLEHVYTKAIENTQKIAAAYRSMAVTPADAQARDLVLEMVYTMPKMPRRDEMPEPIYINRIAKAAQDQERIVQRRDGVAELFAGKGMGMDTKAARGTVWGLYNAVVEMEDYGGKGIGTRAAAESAIVGDRARTKAAAFDACLELVPVTQRPKF